MTGNVQPSISATVCVVSDVRIYRDGLVLVLQAVHEFQVTAVAGHGSNAAQAVAAARPDVVIVDMGAPEGVEMLRIMRRELPAAKVVAFGVDDRVEEIVACAEAGAAGYVCREASADELVDIVRRAVCDEIVCPPKIAASVFRRLASLAGRTGGTGEPLTIREQQVLDLIRDGLANKQIASELSIAESTVKNHVHHVLEKLNVKRRAQAARMHPERRRRTG